MSSPAQPERLPLSSPDLAAERLARLRELLPGAFAEGKLVPAKLAELVGAAALSATPERYGLSYAGRAEALREMLAPSPGTLRPERDQSVAWDATENLIIEGDNLHVLKLLQSAYAGAVKLIYIDPPYNTGSDFVYPDDFRAGVKHYKELTQQTLSTNAETSGRYHSDWLKMMHPRLALARNLLRDDGVIFVSIDDHEVHNLRLLMDEVFGEENFCGQFVWEKKKKPSFLNANMGIVTEHVVSYARYRPAAPAFTFGKVEDGKKFPFNNAGNAEAILTFPIGSVRFGVSEIDFEPADMSEGAIKCELLDRVEVRGYTNVQAFRLRGEWRYSQAKLDEFLANEDEIYIAKAPFRPNYINREDRDKKCKNLLSISSGIVGTYEDATAEMIEFFGSAPFEYTKPSSLLSFFVQLVAKKDDLILDFFAGSGTTGQAVLELNRQDGGNRKFILVQFPEPTGRADFATITDITRERVRRVIARRPTDLATGKAEGFRAYRLDDSNFKLWDADAAPADAAALAKQLELMAHNVLDGRGDDDLLAELLLKCGHPGVTLTSAVETREIAGAPVHLLAPTGSGLAEGRLAICLARTLTQEVLRGIVALKPQRVLCLDVGFHGNDQLKTNTVLEMKSHGVQFQTV